MTWPVVPGSDERLQAALADYRARRLTGEGVDRVAFLRAFAELAGDLSPHLDAIDRAAAPTGLQQTIASLQGAAPRLADLPGTTVFGDYELIEELARGGMGVVFRARQRSLGRLVAVKMILGGRLASATDVQRFRTEAGAAAALDHPHIVPIYEIGELEGQHYFSMKLIEGGSLAQWIGRAPVEPTPTASRPATSRGSDTTPPPSWSTATAERKDFAARLTAAVARAVHYAHQRGVLHRDLKPANILLAADGQPQITDFGLAKLIEEDSELTATGAIMGTPGYMAPEQCGGHKGATTVATDVYSLGVVLFELLTGRPPFRAATPLETLRQVVEREPPPPRQLVPSIDNDLDTIVLKCLEKQPERRYASAAELADDLDRWRAGEPIVARATTGWERAWKWARRRPAAAALLAVSAASLLTLLIFGGVLWRNAELRAEAVNDLNEAQQRLDSVSAELNDARGEKASLLAAAVALREESNKLNAALATGGAELDRFRHLSRLTAYAADMQLARAAAESDSLARLHDLLDRHRPGPGEEDVRSIEWHYLWRFSHGEVRSWQARTPRDPRMPAPPRGSSGSLDPVALAISADGEQLVTAAGDGLLRVWSIPQQQHLRSVECPPGPVAQLSFSADGRGLTIVSLAKKQFSALNMFATALGHAEPSLDPLCDALRVRQIVIGQSVPTSDALPDRPPLDIAALESRGLDPADPANPLDFSSFAGEEPPFGTMMMLENRVLVPVSLAISPDRATAAIGGLSVPVYGGEGSPNPTAPGPASPEVQGGVLLWDIAQRRPGRFLASFKSPVVAVTFSPDSQWLAACGFDRSIHLTRLDESAAETLLAGHAAAVVSLTYSPQGNRLASGDGNGLIKLWDVAGGREVGTLRGHVGEVSRLAFFPGGERLVSSSSDGELKLWDVALPVTPVTVVSAGKPLVALAIDDAGRRLLAVDSAGAVLATDADRVAFEPTGVNLGRAPIVVVSSDGQRIAWVEQGFLGQQLWIGPIDRETDRRKLSGFVGGIVTLAFSPSGRYLAAGTLARQAFVWNAETGELLASSPEQSDPIVALAFSPNEQYLAVGGRDDHNLAAGGPVALWPWTANKPAAILAVRPGAVRSLAFARDGRLAVARDDVVQVWRARDERWAEANRSAASAGDDAAWEVELSIRTYAHFVRQLGFTADGRRLLTACQPNDIGAAGNSLQLWDTTTGQEVLAWGQAQEVATQFVASTDGSLLLAAFQQHDVFAMQATASVVRLFDATPLEPGELPPPAAR